MRSVKQVLRKVRWSVQQRGVGGTLRVLISRATESSSQEQEKHIHPFDAAYGVETGGLIGGGDLGTGHAHDAYITAYVGMSPSRFHATMQRWQATPMLDTLERYTFVDLGSGKARAVMMASKFAFREVIGVELSPELSKVAEKNIAIWTGAGRAMQPVRVVCGDATEFPLPAGPCLVYLANPFGAPVMRKLLEAIEARVESGGGSVDVVYQNPEQEEVFTEFPRFVRLWSEVIPISAEDIAADQVYTPRDRCNLYRR